MSTKEEVKNIENETVKKGNASTFEKILSFNSILSNDFNWSGY